MCSTYILNKYYTQCLYLSLTCQLAVTAVLPAFVYISSCTAGFVLWTVTRTELWPACPACLKTNQVVLFLVVANKN